MPRIDAAAISVEKKPFKKKNYRPWDLLGDFGPLLTANPTVDKNKVDTEAKLDINKITNRYQLDISTTKTQDQSDYKDITKDQQLDNNKISIGEQLDINKVSDKVSIRQQLDNKKISIGEQLDINKVTNRYPIGYQENQSNGQETVKNPAVTCEPKNNGSVDYLDAILRLSGHQKTLFLFVLDCCVSKGLLSTGNVSMDTIRNAFETIGYGTVKLCIHRLAEKGLILREKGKRGRGGFNRFSINEAIRSAALEFRRITNGIGNELDNKKISNREQLDIQLDNKGPLSSSSYKTTTTEEGFHELPLDWQTFDFSPLQEIGFGKAHVLQIQRKGLINFQVAQESVYAFAFDLKRNQKAKTLTKSPLEFFMGILGKGYPYAPPENYESPKDEAMRLYTERLQALKEKREHTEKLAMELAFEEWAATLTKEERNKIIPGVVGMKNENAKRASLIHHFRENVWPEMKERAADAV